MRREIDCEPGPSRRIRFRGWKDDVLQLFENPTFKLHDVVLDHGVKLPIEHSGHNVSPQGLPVLGPDAISTFCDSPGTTEKARMSSPQTESTEEQGILCHVNGLIRFKSSSILGLASLSIGSRDRS